MQVLLDLISKYLLRIAWKMDVKCTQTCSQSVCREVTNCRMYEVDANWIIMFRWTLKVLACWQFLLAQNNSGFLAVLVAIMVTPDPKKPRGFHLSFHKLSVFQQILLRGKKTFVLRKIVGLYIWLIGEFCRQNPPLMQLRYYPLFWERPKRRPVLCNPPHNRHWSDLSSS